MTGVPDPQTQHAVIMCKFASDAMQKMQGLIRGKLVQELGEDTADLAFRVGIHSGSITGGVLRGGKTTVLDRFGRESSVPLSHLMMCFSCSFSVFDFGGQTKGAFRYVVWRSHKNWIILGLWFTNVTMLLYLLCFSFLGTLSIQRVGWRARDFLVEFMFLPRLPRN